jgi:hypothetical protein
MIEFLSTHQLPCANYSGEVKRCYFDAGHSHSAVSRGGVWSQAKSFITKHVSIVTMGLLNCKAVCSVASQSQHDTPGFEQ